MKAKEILWPVLYFRPAQNSLIDDDIKVQETHQISFSWRCIIATISMNGPYEIGLFLPTWELRTFKRSHPSMYVRRLFPPSYGPCRDQGECIVTMCWLQTLGSPVTVFWPFQKKNRELRGRCSTLQQFAHARCGGLHSRTHMTRSRQGILACPPKRS